MRPRQAYSWRKYQADKQNNNTTCKDKPGFPTTFRELIRLLFMDLSNDELQCALGHQPSPLKNTTPSFLPRPHPLNLKTFQVSLFWQSPPIFSEPPKYQSFSSLTPSYL